MDPDTCPDCHADLQEVGVLEHGLASFEAHLVWNPEEELYEMKPDEEPSLIDTSNLSYACAGCGSELGFDPNDWDDE